MAGNNPLEDLLQQLKNARAAPGSNANGTGNVSLGSVGRGVGSGGSLLGGLGIFGLAAVALMIYNAYYTIPSDSVGIVQRFGEYSAEKDPGLHFKMPLGIDTVTILPVKRQLKQEFGFATGGATNVSQNRPDFAQQGQMVTGDLNAALVEWVVQYRIAEPRKYLFDTRNPAETLRDISESIMRLVVGDRSVDEVITIGRQEIETVALAEMQFLAAKYEIGVSIDQVQLKNINPPRPVQASFNEVNQAQQEKESLINAARREFNKVIPLAEGEKDQRIRAADGYRLRRVNEAEGDTARFNAVFAEYSKAPEVTRRRIYIETMQEVLPQLDNKIIMDENAQQMLPLMHLNSPQGVLQ